VRGIKMNKHRKKIAAMLLELAYEVKPDTDLPASIMAAQAILETGWLRHMPVDSKTAVCSNNILGIKAIPGKYEGSNGYVTTGTWEWDSVKGRSYFLPKATFRAYNNYEECFRDYGVVIWNSMVNVKVFGVKTPLKMRRYREALKYRVDPQCYLCELWNAGYATDPKYVEKVWKIAVSCGYLKDYLREEEKKDG
jgi:flagellar protein FlgJ